MRDESVLRVIVPARPERPGDDVFTAIPTLKFRRLSLSVF
jgi:hypothetical protein